MTLKIRLFLFISKIYRISQWSKSAWSHEAASQETCLSGREENEESRMKGITLIVKRRSERTKDGEKIG